MVSYIVLIYEAETSSDIENNYELQDGQANTIETETISLSGGVI